VGTFSAKVSSLSDIHRREKNLPSSIQMKQINVCWLKRIRSLRKILNELDVAKNKRGDLFFNLMDLTKELNNQNLLMEKLFYLKRNY